MFHFVKHRVAYPLTGILKEFVAGQQAVGLVLVFSGMVSMIWANSSWGPVLFSLLGREAGFSVFGLPLHLTLQGWVNDGLMSIFFLLIGLEIKREFLTGELSSADKALMPALAAIGGMVVPAVIFVFFNQGLPTASGWGIPMATDIAFSLGLLSLLGRRVPVSLKVLLTALAVIDDLGAILVIAVFYTADLHGLWLLGSGLTFLLLVLLNRAGVRSLFPYLLFGLVLWFMIHESGIHATIAGVLLAFAIPCRSGANAHSPLEKLEHGLHKPVNFFIMPVFALANAAMIISPDMIGSMATPLGLGILFGLALGKPLGILLFTWIPVRLKIIVLPRAVGWNHVIGMGLMAGIGFTMSIFITFLAFSDPLVVDTARISIIAASVLAAVLGLAVLALSGRSRH